MFKYKNDENEEKNDYWMSYSDLMAGVLLVIILFLFTAILRFNEDQSVLEYQSEKLEKQEEQINNLIGLRRTIVSDLINELKDSNINVNVDPDTGDIRLSSGVFFEPDKFYLKQNGKNFLDKFLSVYLRVLLYHKDNISEIIIEGHTDDVGGYLYNLELSQDRAFEVTKYIYSDSFTLLNDEEKHELQSLLTSNGKSYSNLIYNGAVVDRDKSRRVEFKFSLKDDEIVKQIKSIIEGE